MTEKPILLGLLGYPLGHSFSPLLHNTALNGLSITGEYKLFPVPDENSLKAHCQKMRQRFINGLNVTIPWKIGIIDYLDQLSEEARKIGAVNTIYLKNDRLVGANTDVLGFQNEINNVFGSELHTSNKTALILGAGGAARAVAWTLGRMGWRVTLAARRLKQAQLVKLALSHAQISIRAITLTPEELSGESPDLLINATPVGMTPAVDESSWPDALPLPKNTVVFDLIYNPPETKLLSTARMQGLMVINGAGMLVSQAAAAFQLWTATQPPKDLMYASLEDALMKLQRSKK